jgi:acyl-CoA thioesterase-2
MGDFALDTAVEGRDGRYQARLSRDWEIWGPNGGYVAAIALRAAGAATPLRRPASFSCHFLAAAAFDTVDLTVTPLRQAKRAASLRVSMSQRGQAILEAVVWVVGEVGGLEHDFADMPAVPRPHDLKSVEELLAGEVHRPHPFWGNFECRPVDWQPWESRDPGPPVVRRWFRFRPRARFDDPFVDAARSLLVIDTMGWPAANMPHPNDQPYIAPSLDAHALFHRLAPDVEWLLCDATAPVAAEGLIGGVTRVWSPDGKLLASGGGQLLCRPAPREG